MRITPLANVCALLAACLLISAGCKTPQEGLVGEPPPDDLEPARARMGGQRRIQLPSTDQRKLPARRYPRAIFSAPLWPYIEDGTTFELHWGAASTSLSAHEHPDRNSPITGQYRVQRGQQIRWRSSWEGVYRPSVFRARKRVQFDGTLYAPEDPDRNGIAVSTSAQPGQAVAVYAYAGGASCYVGVGQTLLLTACPSPADFSGHFSGRTRAEQMQPQERIWWVHIETTTINGWIQLDDRVQVDIIRE